MLNISSCTLFLFLLFSRQDFQTFLFIEKAVHQSHITKKKIGPKVHQQIRANHPQSSTSMELPPCDDALEMNDALFKACSQNEGQLMKKKAKVVEVVETMDSANAKEVREIAQFFLRLNPRNSRDVTDAKSIMNFFRRIDMKKTDPALLSCLHDHIDQMLVQAKL